MLPVVAGAVATRPAKSYYNKAVPAPSSFTTESWREMQGLGKNNQPLANKTPTFLNFRPSFPAPRPLQLLHPCFGTFMDIFHGRDPHCNPGRREFGFLKTQSQAMCDIFDGEHARQVLHLVCGD